MLLLTRATVVEVAQQALLTRGNVCQVAHGAPISLLSAASAAAAKFKPGGCGRPVGAVEVWLVELCLVVR
jgi:hypothetical protein